MIIKRALTVPLPTVWSKFQRTQNGKTYKFKIREALPNEKETLAGFVSNIFMRNEPSCVAFRISEDKIASEELKQLFYYFLQYDYNGMCFDVTNEEKPILAAGNLFFHLNQTEPLVLEPFKSEPMKKLSKLVDMMMKAENVFEKFKVSHYLQGIAMATDPEYRNLGLASEMILAREPVCKAFGIPLSAILFSGAASQRVGEKVGYKTYATLDYKELGRIFDVDFNSPVESMKITYKRIDL